MKSCKNTESKKMDEYGLPDLIGNELDILLGIGHFKA